MVRRIGGVSDRVIVTPPTLSYAATPFVVPLTNIAVPGASNMVGVFTPAAPGIFELRHGPVPPLPVTTILVYKLAWRVFESGGAAMDPQLYGNGPALIPAETTLLQLRRYGTLFPLFPASLTRTGFAANADWYQAGFTDTTGSGLLPNDATSDNAVHVLDFTRCFGGPLELGVWGSGPTDNDAIVCTLRGDMTTRVDEQEIIAFGTTQIAQPTVAA